MIVTVPTLLAILAVVVACAVSATAAFRYRGQVAQLATREELLRAREQETGALAADFGLLVHNSDLSFVTLADVVLRRIRTALRALEELDDRDGVRLSELELSLERETDSKERKKLYDDKARVFAARRGISDAQARLHDFEQRFDATMAALKEASVADHLLGATELALAVHLSFRGSAAEAAADRENAHRAQQQRYFEERMWELRKRRRLPGEDAIALDLPV